MVIVAKKTNIKLKPTNYAAHTLRQGGCTDMTRHGVPSWRIHVTRRWSSKEWKKIYIKIDWRDMAKLSGFTVSSLLHQTKSQALEN